VINDHERKLRFFSQRKSWVKPNKSFGFVSLNLATIKDDSKLGNPAKGPIASKLSSSALPKRLTKGQTARRRVLLESGFGVLNDFLEEKVVKVVSDRGRSLLKKHRSYPTCLTPRVFPRKEWSLKGNPFFKDTSGTHKVGNTKYALKFLHNAEILRLKLMDLYEFHWLHEVPYTRGERNLVFRAIRTLSPDNPYCDRAWFNQICYFSRRALLGPSGVIIPKGWRTYPKEVDHPKPRILGPG